MRLYHDPISGNCYKVRLLLGHLGSPCELVEVSIRDGRPAELAELSPADGRVPLLVLDDGRALPESGAILWHLAQGTPYLPDDAYDRARVLGWMFFEQNLHEPNVSTRRFWKAYAPDPERRADQMAFWLERGNEALATMDRWLSSHDWFAAGQYTIADMALYGYTHVAGEGGFELDAFPAVDRWLHRVLEQPGHVPMG